MLRQRVGFAVAAIPVVVGIVGFAPRWLFVSLVLLLVLVAQWELYRMFARVGVTVTDDPRPLPATPPTPRR